MELDDEVGYITDRESALSEHEAIDPAHTVNTQSFEEELSSEEDLDEWLNAEMEKRMSKQKKENEEDALIAIIKSIREECRDVHKNKQTRNNVMPRNIYEYLKLDNLGGDTMSVEMDDMIQQETLGTVKNVLVKINKFEFPCDFVVIEMPRNLGEMIILGRPFLETIHAK
ncbi:reverse transcriptase domain-containing protein [Tanacetum coccineum]